MKIRFLQILALAALGLSACAPQGPALPPELAFVTGARAHVDAEGALQVGLDVGPGIDPAVYPHVEPGVGRQTKCAGRLRRRRRGH